MPICMCDFEGCDLEAKESHYSNERDFSPEFSYFSNSTMSDFCTAVEALVGLRQTEVKLYMLKEQLHEALQALQSQCSELQVQLNCEEQTCAQQEVAKTLELADSSLGSAMQEEQHVHQQLQEVVQTIVAVQDRILIVTIHQLRLQGANPDLFKRMKCTETGAPRQVEISGEEGQDINPEIKDWIDKQKEDILALQDGEIRLAPVSTCSSIA